MQDQKSSARQVLDKLWGCLPSDTRNESMPARSPQKTKAFEQLVTIGFRKCGEWQQLNNKLQCELFDHATALNVLYAFVINGDVCYIGKTVRSLNQRMYGYQNPGESQSTNIKGNRLIQEALATDARVEIYALPDNGLLHYGGFHVNLAAGLEDSLIDRIKPLWNKTRR